MAPYPTKSEIEHITSNLAAEDPTPFFEHVAPDVIWDVMGTHPVAGRFEGVESWKQNAQGPIIRMLREPTPLRTVNVCGGGDQEWAMVELASDAVCKNGMDYRQRYVWAVRFNKEKIIIHIRAYMDSALVQQAMDANP